jgi:toxin ParE1/3/4
LQSEIRYYRKHAGGKVAARLTDAVRASLDTLQRQPAIGSPVLGQQLGIESLRTWDVSGFPLVLVYVEREQRLDVVRILGQRQDIATLISLTTGKPSPVGR